MSRSYKKTPRSGDRKSPRSGVSMKKVFNRAIRREPMNEDSCASHSKRLYRKKHCSWDICDYQTVGLTFEEYWRATQRRCQRLQLLGLPVKTPTKEEAYREWYKYYKAK